MKKSSPRLHLAFCVERNDFCSVYTNRTICLYWLCVCVCVWESTGISSKTRSQHKLQRVFWCYGWLMMMCMSMAIPPWGARSLINAALSLMKQKKTQFVPQNRKLEVNNTRTHAPLVNLIAGQKWQPRENSDQKIAALVLMRGLNSMSRVRCHKCKMCSWPVCLLCAKINSENITWIQMRGGKLSFQVFLAH